MNVVDVRSNVEDKLKAQSSQDVVFNSMNLSAYSKVNLSDFNGLAPK